MRNILFIILIITLSACSSKRKVSRNSQVYEVTGHSVSKEEGNTETSVNLKIDKTVETSLDGETTEETTTISSLYPEKESKVVLQDGTSVSLNNAIYVKKKVFKKETENKKESIKLDSIAETKIYFKKEDVIESDIVSEVKSENIDRERNTFNWLYLLIPGAIIAGGYVFYKVNPQAKLFNLFRKT
jgi:hypothetical protein